MKQYDPQLQSAFDLHTYKGRLQHFNMMLFPSNFFHYNQTIKDYQNTLKKIETDPSLQKQYSNQKLWEMKYVILSNTHPQTKECISIPFRTSGFIITNTPISFLLAVLPPTPINQIMSQTINQTFNFCFNYSNRNLSNIYNYKEMTFSYLCAITVAISSSLGTAAISRRITFNKFAQKIVLSISPYIGVALASSFNLFFSRYQDFIKGIQVCDIETEMPIRDSCSLQAAKIAFFQALASRVIIPIPVFMIPIGGMNLLKYYNKYPKGKLSQNIFGSTLAALGLWIGSTVGFALFEQQSKIHVSLLEEQFHNLKDKKEIKLN
ncbi:tricarboxylate carrier family protein, putative, partial [Ichthyophthirius multifiliis]